MSIPTDVCIMGMGHAGIHFTGASVQGYNSILCKLDAPFDTASYIPCQPIYFVFGLGAFERKEPQRWRKQDRQLITPDPNAGRRA